MPSELGLLEEWMTNLALAYAYIDPLHCEESNGHMALSKKDKGMVLH